LRSFVYVEQKNYDKAVADLSEVIRFKPDDKDAYFERAEVYRKLGKNDLAEADDKKYRELSGDTEQNVKPTGNSNNSGSVKTISGGILNGKATNLVQPKYSAAAKAVRASGAVNVQVTVDENGNVISATAVSGHTLLRASAEAAAKESKFNPTLLSGEKVRVSGIIVYNFTAE
jgi:TonB family protein